MSDGTKFAIFLKKHLRMSNVKDDKKANDYIGIVHHRGTLVFPVSQRVRYWCYSALVTPLLSRNELHNPQLVKYDLQTLTELCELSRDIFKTESSLCEINPPVVIVGDIHGQYFDLLRMFSLFNADGAHGALCNKFVFLGDYVDRGRHSLECVVLILLLKVNFPKKYVLLRGNHECATVNKVYGFYDELKDRFPKSEAELIFTSVNEMFNWMPVADCG